MTRFIVLLFLFILVLFLPLAKAEDRCLFLARPIQEASFKYISKDFPYWYNIGLAKKETNCKWIKSLDGHGSVGYFQLTPKFLDTFLRPLFPDYDKEYSKDHFYAFAYYLRSLIETSPVKKLWVIYQRYNGGDWVLYECKLAKSYDYKACMEACYKCRELGGKRCRGIVCVWRTPSGDCKQYRHACEINYSYSVFIYQKGQDYRVALSGKDGRWIYW